MPIFFIILILVALGVLVGSHLFLYFTLVRFWGITGKSAKRAWLIAFVLLSLSFIFSVVLQAFYHNIFTEYFYIAVSVWLAMLVHLFLACALLWIVYFIAKSYALTLKYRYWVIVFMVLAISITAFGAWNAQNPQLKFITVKIENLPPDWQGKTAIQLSDVHAGIIHDKKFLNRLQKKLDPIRKDIIFITGDYFDSEDGDFRVYVEPLKNIQAEKGIYFVAGNHERYIGEDRVFAAMKEAGVNVLKDEIVNIDGLNIIGVDFPGEMQTNRDLSWLFEMVKPEEANILLYHEPRLIEQAKKYGVDLQLAGHTHKGQIWPFGYITRLIYGQYHVGLHQEGSYTIHTSTGTGSWGPPIRTGNVPEIVVITLENK